MNRVTVLATLILFLSACADYQTYQPSPIDIEQTTREYRIREINSPEIKDWLKEHDQNVEIWPREQWDIESLVLVGKYFSTDLAVAEAKVKVAEAAEITAGHKPNPTIELSSEHHSEQPDGVSPWTLGTIFSWIYERPEKRQARIDHARAVTEVARLKQFEIEWQIRDAIMDNYLDAIAAIHKKKMLLEEKVILEQAQDVLARRMELGQASDFEISSTRLELQRLRLMINEAEADQIKALSQLALAVGLPANALNNIKLDPRHFEHLPDLTVYNLDLELLQTRALIERPDVLRVLSEYAVVEADLHREIENQYPDITLSPGFIFDQEDKLWVLAGSWLLPINNRNEGPIAEAEARRKVKGQEFLALQTSVLGEVHNAYIRYRTALQTFNEAQSLINELQVRGEKIQKQFELGYTDRLGIIRNQLEILTAQRSKYLLELTAWQEFAGLEDALKMKLTTQ